MIDQLHTGSIRISNDVISKIAGKAAMSTPQITAMSGGISEGIVKRLSGKSISRGVSVHVDQMEVGIDLKVIVKYGCMIQEVCHLLQQNVQAAVENMTGLMVSTVNVKVEGVDLYEAEEDK